VENSSIIYGNVRKVLSKGDKSHKEKKLPSKEHNR
jgi:hypothetical protein